MVTRRTRQIFTSVICACIVCYFLYRTIEGDHGWLAMLRLQNETEASQANLSQLQQEHKELAHRVQLMRPSSLDPDLLDEKSREMLDYSKPNEIIVLTPPDQKDQKPGVVQRSK
ncbi:MAG TPA: septum formation initiator family protein [Alphaproteobacteria bacterium]|nr:septum formation initiator family protein [Alphaproteobacteria bacterium]